MLHKVFRDLDNILALVKSFPKGRMDGTHHQNPKNENKAQQKLKEEYNRKPRREGPLLKALQELHHAMLQGWWASSTFFTFPCVSEFNEFVNRKDFEIWRADHRTPVKYLGYKAVFDSFHDELMQQPVIAREAQRQEKDKGKSGDTLAE
jgi:hypothetical protein